MAALFKALWYFPLDAGPTLTHGVKQFTHRLIDAGIWTKVESFSVKSGGFLPKPGSQPKVAAQGFEHVLPGACCLRTAD